MKLIDHRSTVSVPSAGGKHAAAGRESFESSLARLAAIGVSLLAARTVIVQAVGFAGNIVIARQLGVSAFGVVAVGLTATQFAITFADGGLAAGLIRSPVAPTATQLRSAFGLQLAVMTAFPLAVISVLLFTPTGQVGTITALMLASVPLMALQTPAKVVLERQLNYRCVAFVEVAEVCVYYIWGVCAVLLGFGVWGFASATCVRGIAAAALLWGMAPSARVAPRWSGADNRSLLGFGLKYQAVNATNLIRDQGLNAATALILGTSALGIWALAYRVLQGPLLVFNALWRISYPTMARVVAANRQPRALLERAVMLVAVVSALILSTLAGVGPALVPLLFGSAWHDVAYVVAPSCLALMIGGPISIATAGYLYAIDATKAVLRSAVWHTVAWFAISLPLLPVLGVPAIGLGLIGGSVVDAVLLARAAARFSGARLGLPILGPVFSGGFAAGLGWIVATDGKPTWARVALVAGVTTGTYVTCLTAWTVTVARGQSPSLIVELRAFAEGLRFARPTAAQTAEIR
jgi:O-antigen/teichoic acid export membrane protein